MKMLRYIPLMFALVCMTVSCKKEIPDMVSADVKEFSVSGDGESVKVNITANRQWVATTENDWITLPNAQSEGGTSQLTIRVKKSDAESSREGLVRVVAGDASVTIKIVQRLRISLDLDVAGAYVEYTGDTISMQLTSNADYSVEIIEGAEWIRKVDTKATTDVLNFVVEPNTTKKARKGKILFTEPVEGKKKEFLVNQYAMPDILDITYSGNTMSAIDFAGNAPKIATEWGDGNRGDYYKSSPEYSYEQSGDYQVKVYVRESDGFTIKKMSGISSLDISNY